MTTKPLSPAAALKSVQAKQRKLAAALDRIDKAVVVASQARQELTYELDALAEAQNRPLAPVAAKPVRNGNKKAQARAEEE